MIRASILLCLACSAVFAQGYVWNPFTKKLDRIGGDVGAATYIGRVQEEGVNLTQQPTINFTGAGVTCVNNGATSATDCDIPTPTAAIQTIFEDGVALTARNALNFIGAAVTCADNAGTSQTDCTVSTGGGTGLNSLTVSGGIVKGGDLVDPTLSFGRGFGSTVTASTYPVVSGDCGTAKRFANSTGIAVSLPLLTYPCEMMMFNDGIGPVVITATPSGDINNDSTLTLQNQEGALLSLNNTAAFWRGITITGRVQSGAGAPASGRCDELSEVGQVYVRNNAGASDASLYACVNNGVLTYGWEGPFAVSAVGGGASSYSELSDFSAVATSASVLTITSGVLLVGNYPMPTTIGGAVTFSAGTGTAKIFVDEDGILVTEATTGITTSSTTGQMTFRNATTPAVPETAVPICDLTVASAVYTIVQCGQAARVSNGVVKAGTGLTKTVANGKATFAVDSAAVCMAGVSCGIESVQRQVIGPATTITTGDGKVYIRVSPKMNGMVLTAVHVQLVTVSSSGAVNVDVARCATVATGNACSGTVVDMLSTNLTVDANEDDSSTAAAAAVIDTANDDVTTNQVIRVDVDSAGTGAAGLYITLDFQLP